MDLHELHRIRTAARTHAYQGPVEDPWPRSSRGVDTLQVRTRHTSCLFQVLFRARRFLREVERAHPRRWGLSQDATERYEYARKVANLIIDELDRRWVRIEEHCPDCDRTDFLHAAGCPRLACACYDASTLVPPGIEYPALLPHNAARLWVTRCISCGLYESDEAAAAALSEAWRTSYSLGRYTDEAGNRLRPCLDWLRSDASAQPEARTPSEQVHPGAGP